jgi:hypothetical protein
MINLHPANCGKRQYTWRFLTVTTVVIIVLVLFHLHKDDIKSAYDKLIITSHWCFIENGFVVSDQPIDVTKFYFILLAYLFVFTCRIMNWWNISNRMMVQFKFITTKMVYILWYRIQQMIKRCFNFHFI